MPLSHSGRLYLFCKQTPYGHVGSNPTGGSFNYKYMNVIYKKVEINNKKI